MITLIALLHGLRYFRNLAQLVRLVRVSGSYLVELVEPMFTCPPDHLKALIIIYQPPISALLPLSFLSPDLQLQFTLS